MLVGNHTVILPRIDTTYCLFDIRHDHPSSPPQELKLTEEAQIIWDAICESLTQLGYSDIKKMSDEAADYRHGWIEGRITLLPGHDINTDMQTACAAAGYALKYNLRGHIDERAIHEIAKAIIEDRRDGKIPLGVEAMPKVEPVSIASANNISGPKHSH